MWPLLAALAVFLALAFWTWLWGPMGAFLSSPILIVGLVLKEHSDAVYGVSFSPDSKYLASTGADRAVKVWDVATGKLQYTLGDSTDWNYTVAWSPDGIHLAAGGVDKSIRVWRVDATGGRIAHSVFAHEGPVTRIAYSKDGKTLYSVGQDRVLKAWDAAAMVERKVYDKQPESVLSLAAPFGLSFGMPLTVSWRRWRRSERSGGTNSLPL